MTPAWDPRKLLLPAQVGNAELETRGVVHTQGNTLTSATESGDLVGLALFSKDCRFQKELLFWNSATVPVNCHLPK